MDENKVLQKASAIGQKRRNEGLPPLQIVKSSFYLVEYRVETEASTSAFSGCFVVLLLQIFFQTRNLTRQVLFSD